MKEEKTGRVMSAHQPNFLPYLGFFDKMMQSDIFIIRDECQFCKRDYHHRNRIKIQGTNGNKEPNWTWLTIPVGKEEIDLKDVAIKNEVKQKNVPWNVFMARQIKSSYEKTLFFKEYYPKLENILLSKNERLIDLTMDVVNFLKDSFKINTEIVYATQLPGYTKTFNASVDLANLTKAVDADIYLSGSGGKTYLGLEPFEKQGIEVRFQEYNHPIYPQRFEGFAPYMAAIDALFNAGPGIFKTRSNKEDKKEENKKELQMQQA